MAAIGTIALARKIDKVRKTVKRKKKRRRERERERNRKKIK